MAVNKLEYLEKLKESLRTAPNCEPWFYSSKRKACGELCLDLGYEKEAIYHFSETHSMALRRSTLLNHTRRGDSVSNEYLSFSEGYAKDEIKGLEKRLQEMPKEWTIVQLTREFDATEYITTRKKGNAPPLKSIHLTRYPCGSEFDTESPVTVRCFWPKESQVNILQAFWEIHKKLGTKTGNNNYVTKQRNSAASDAQSFCNELGPHLLKEWAVLLLGTLCSSDLRGDINTKIEKVLTKSETRLSKRQKYLLRLLAEGVVHLTSKEIDIGITQLIPDDETLQNELFQVMNDMKENLNILHAARRNPVLLIVDEHLDLLPWEYIPVLKRHPVSRVPSIHFAHLLYNLHKDDIKNGMRLLKQDEVCYYIINPSGDLVTVEERIAKFFKKRFPDWIGIVGRQPTENELKEALTTSNTYIYCGHGSGSIYFNSETFVKLKVKPVQILFGCSSNGLTDYGGLAEMTGDFFTYTVAGSGCTVGMLYPVTTNDTDKITTSLANLWLPGTPVDPDTLEKLDPKKFKKEPELLRAMKQAVEDASLFTNKVSFIARGIPIKMVD